MFEETFFLSSALLIESSETWGSFYPYNDILSLICFYRISSCVYSLQLRIIFFITMSNHSC